MFDSLSHVLKKKSSSSDAAQATTIQGFLSVPNAGLEHEFSIGSLAFLKEEYRIARGLLIAIDESDETHDVFGRLKRLSAAPVKTLIVLLRGRESTYARKETGFLGMTSYVALYWNHNDEDAAEQLGIALHNVEKWMRGKREARYPSLPAPVAKKTPAASAVLKKTEMSLIKTAKPTLNFSRDALKKK